MNKSITIDVSCFHRDEPHETAGNIVARRNMPDPIASAGEAALV
jgi:hypothetical protein